MLDRMVHRGPDDEGFYTSAEVCLGHRRLSIIDLSPGGHQPMVDGQNVLVYNGEIYNYKNLRAELQSQDVTFRSDSDSEVLLKGYRVWGIGVVSRLRGMYAFALWDGEQRRLLCARDPFGKKPLYYYWSGKEFAFASEVEALVSSLTCRPEADSVGLNHYLFVGYFPPGQSVYSGVRTVHAGHYLLVDTAAGRVEEWAHWHGRFGAVDGGRDGDSPSRWDSLLTTSIERRLQSDVPVGVLLSGGVDSSLVTLLASERAASPLDTFTAAFADHAFNEARYAALVAERAGNNHREVEVSIDSLPDLLERLVVAYGEPFGDDSAIPTFYLFQAIRHLVKVVLTGDGGDEVFGGYKDVRLFLLHERLSGLRGATNFAPAHVISSLLTSRWHQLRHVAYLLAILQRDGRNGFVALHQSGWTAYWRRRIMRPEVWDRTGGNAVEHELGSRFTEAGETSLDRYMNMTIERLIQDHLVKIDRASMAHSVEARCPMLDVDLFQEVRGLPRDLVFAGGEPKGILKEKVDAYMGSGFARRPKQGFTPPLGDWLRRPENAAWMEENLTDPHSFVYSWFSPQAMRRLVADHLRGATHERRLWRLLFLNCWHTRCYR